MESIPSIKPSRSSRPTIAQVAKQAGVSVPTVSKVINGRSDVAPETRLRVEAIIRERGYKRLDRSIRRAQLIELIFHELESEWALELVMGVEQVARENHLAVVITEMHGRRTPGRGWLEGVLDRRPTGVIAVFSDLTETMRAQLKTRGIPFVVVDPTGEPMHDTPSVGATNWSGGLAATRHLLALGHRRVGVITGPREILCSRARLDGYRAAMDAAGVAIDPDLIRYGDFHVESGVQHSRAMLALADPPTRDLRRQRPDGPGCLPGGPRGPTPHPGGPQRRRLRRSAGRRMGRAAVDDRPPAARRDGGHRRPSRPGARARRSEPAQTRVELATELIVRESTGTAVGSVRVHGGLTGSPCHHGTTATSRS